MKSQKRVIASVGVGVKVAGSGWDLRLTDLQDWHANKKDISGNETGLAQHTGPVQNSNSQFMYLPFSHSVRKFSDSTPIHSR